MDFLSHFFCGANCAPDVGEYTVGDHTLVCQDFCDGMYSACSPLLGVTLIAEFATAEEFCRYILDPSNLGSSLSGGAIIVASQPCFGGSGSVTAATSNGAVLLSAGGPQGDVSVTAAQKLQLHAESGPVEVTTSD
eukprot:COSAG02_NODE_40504_length_404_cov_6.177049_1_plen_134_part_11